MGQPCLVVLRIWIGEELKPTYRMTADGEAYSGNIQFKKLSLKPHFRRVRNIYSHDKVSKALLTSRDNNRWMDLARTKWISFRTGLLYFCEALTRPVTMYQAGKKRNKPRGQEPGQQFHVCVQEWDRVVTRPRVSVNVRFQNNNCVP